MIGAAVVAGVLLASGPQAPIGSFPELGAALAACMRGPAPSAASQVDVRFALTARGTLAGQPVLVIDHALGGMAAARGLKAALIDALRRCTPFSLQPDFARAIAGHPLTLRVLTGGRAVLV